MFIYIYKNHCIPLYNHIIILRTYLYLYIYIHIYYICCYIEMFLSISFVHCQLWLPEGRSHVASSIGKMMISGPSFTPILLVSYTKYMPWNIPNNNVGLGQNWVSQELGGSY
jgi:hypothetical protein